MVLISYCPAGICCTPTEATAMILSEVFERFADESPVTVMARAALERHTAAAMGPVVEAMGGRREPWLPGYRVRVLDGSHLPGTEHRLKPLRTERAGALPGQGLVVFDPELALAIDIIPCEDGH